MISDAHSGLIKAIEAVLTGASWQRCRVHFMRNALARVSKGNAEMVAATIRTIFAQPTAKAVRSQLGAVSDLLAPQFPAVAELLDAAAADLTAFADLVHLPLAQGLVHKSHRADKPGDQAPD